MADTETAGTWRARDIAIIFDDDQTDDPVVTVKISTPAGTIMAMAERLAAPDARTLLLRRVHVHAVDHAAGQFGLGSLGACEGWLTP